MSLLDKTHSQWWAFDGHNVDYLLDEYERYIKDPQTVNQTLWPIFRVWQGLDQSEGKDQTTTAKQTETIPKSPTNHSAGDLKVAAKALQLADNIRRYGLYNADINPIAPPVESAAVKLAYYGLSESDLSTLPAGLILENNFYAAETALDAINVLRDIYASDSGLGFEFSHLSLEEQAWFKEKLEGPWLQDCFAAIDYQGLLREVFQVENLEQYLSKTYTGQKRFSVEGLETLIPLLNTIVNRAGNDRFEQVNIAMAHRGRINGLVHVLDQPYEWILAMFEGVAYEGETSTNYDRYNSSMDVKYHLGANTKRQYGDHEMAIHLANNPSHLEAVAGLVHGFTRAAQDNRHCAGYAKRNEDAALAIVVHGDASVTGQGVVYETYNFSRTEAYTNGGSIHIIANNNIGFTAENDETRSTLFASDPAKGYGMPVIHTNADKPEAVIVAGALAYAYRQAFHQDVVIDLLGYRRLGHNENDEPRSTNPLLYQWVDARPTISALYSSDLLARQLVDQATVEDMDKVTWAAYDQARNNLGSKPPAVSDLEASIESRRMAFPPVETKVPLAALAEINEKLLTYPVDLHVFKKLQRILERRKKPFVKEGKVDWGLAEALAFATIIQDGKSIRLSGEDAQRGTFSHRNLMLTDVITGKKYTPMAAIGEGQASFSIYNSTLSEYGVLGFEYGYDLKAKDTLVLWEAQYGDFANPAQVMIDTYIASGRKKFGDISGLVMLLPHGYEGAGPEHSSARLERYLQLSAENNWTVANLTKASQIFHILRRQAALLEDESLRPLILMTPKALLRSEIVASDLDELTEGSFQAIIATDFGHDDQQIERLILGSGRFMVELMENLIANPNEKIALTRIEELYPFPKEALAKNIARYPNLREIIWAQEEPANQGAWAYMNLRLQEIDTQGLPIKRISRPAMASTAEGNGKLHQATQAKLVKAALSL